MKRAFHTFVLLVAVTSLASLAGCAGEVGERCDEFFQNQCRSPASCIEMPEGSWCANSCSGGECEDGFECVTITFQGMAAGDACLPSNR